MKKLIIYFAAALAMFVITNYCDYELQAFQFGWKSFFDLSARAPKWVQPFDSIPHDLWHITQWLRNITMLTAPIFVMFGYANFFSIYPTMWEPPVIKFLNRYRTLLIFIVVIAVYLIARFIGFTMPRFIIQGY